MQTKIKGIPVELNGKTWIVPGLTIGQMETIGDERLNEFGRLDPAKMATGMAGQLDIVQAAMSRNYPEITVDDLKEMVDTQSFIECCVAVIKLSGEGRTHEDGEVEAPSPIPSIGATS